MKFKKILSCSLLITFVLLILVNSLKAEDNEYLEDYNLSIKAYKIDTPLYFIESYLDGEYTEEITENSILNPGDIIAVGVYAKVYNKSAMSMVITLDWSRDLLEEIVYDENYEGITVPALLPENPGTYDDMLANYDSQGEFTSFYAFTNRMNYLDENNNLKNTIHYLSRGETMFAHDGIIKWMFFKVKDTARPNARINFFFEMAEGYKNNGIDTVNISTTPLSFKIEKSNNYERKIGDVNNDGKVDIADYIILNRHIIKVINLSGEDFEYADITKDGKVNSLDLTALNRYLLGKSSL